MRKQLLRETGIATSQLGFGCVQLTFHDRRKAIASLEHAFSQGITHFDVARAYGSGQAEGILGEFLRGKRDRVTVATKLGIQPPRGLAGNQWVIGAAKRCLRPFPWMLRYAQRHSSTMSRSGIFAPSAAIQSLETSLRELKTDYIDFLLLHEATSAEAGDAGLIEALDRLRADSKVRCIGIASDFTKLACDTPNVPAPYQVLQFDDNAAKRNLASLAHYEKRAVITHSIFKPIGALQAATSAHPEIARKFSLELGLDLTDSRTIASLLLHYALRSNADGIVLFSSSSLEHITANIRDADSRHYSEYQLSCFVRFVDEILSQPNHTPVATTTFSLSRTSA